MTTVFLIFKSDPEAVRSHATAAGLIPLIIDAKEAGWWGKIPPTVTDIYIESVENISQVLQYLESIKTTPRRYYSFPPPPPFHQEKEIPDDLVPIVLTYLLGEGTSFEDILRWSREEPKAFRLAAKEVMGSKTLPSLDEAVALFAFIGEGSIQKAWALTGAAREGYFDTVKYLVENGANVNGTGEWGYVIPLEAAAENGHLEIVKYLVEKGADIKKSEDTLPKAVQNGHLEIVKYLVEKGG